MKTRLFAAGIALTALSAAPAQAADFGGNCCADLEERIAELEATTARKGNRKVSLTVYGQINEAIGFWDDGFETNQYVFTNDTSRTRFGFKGSAQISADWYAGYKIEVGVRASDQGALDADVASDAPDFDLRHSSWTIGSKTYGALTMGQTSMAHDGITQHQTARIGHFANPDVLDANDSFHIRQSGTGNSLGEWDNLAQVFEPGEGSRAQAIRYDSPAFAGFTLHAHWGEDDIWGAAVQYEGEFGDFAAAAGIGYGEMSENDEECLSETDIQNIAAGVGRGSRCQEMGLSASVMHKPTGLFVTGAYGIRWDEGRRDALIAAGRANDAGAGDIEELKMYHIQAGIEQQWVSLGKTTLFGGYQKREAGYAVRDGSDPGDNVFNQFMGNNITNFEFDMWEAGLNQQISAAEMDIYLHYKHYEADITTTAGAVRSEPWQTVIMGSRIKF